MAGIETTFEVDFRGTRYKKAEAGLRAYAERTGRIVENAAPVLRESFKWYLDNVAKAMASRHATPWPGGTTKDTLSSRSGALVKSIVDSVNVEGEGLATIRGSIGGNRYARIQEYGGTVVPKKAKYLAIPLPAALDSRGVPIKLSPRQWDNTFISKSKAGNLIIFRREGKKVTPLYVLKDKVYIPPRLGLRDTIKSGMPLLVDRAMNAMLRAIKDAK